MEVYTIDQVIDLWNQKVKGQHKTVVVRRRFKQPDFMKKFDEAAEDIGSLQDWGVIIDESLRVFDDPWWERRRLMQGFNWLFQRRNKGEGELNWVHFYELAASRDERSKLDNEKKDLFKLFATSNNTESLP